MGQSHEGLIDFPDVTTEESALEPHGGDPTDQSSPNWMPVDHLGGGEGAPGRHRCGDGESEHDDEPKHAL